MFLPVPSDRASGATLTVVDYRTLAVRSGPASNGQAIARFPAVDEGYLWLVDRMTVMCDSTTTTQCTVYAGEANPLNFVDGTSRGNLDVADEASPILIPSGVELTAVWAGASVGAVGTIRVQYQLVVRG